MNIIETENLCYSYDGKINSLDNVSIGFEKGKTTAILGGNGAGKSTLFLNLNGILIPASGTIKYNGKAIKYTKSAIKELRKNIGIIFQDPDDQLFSASVYQDISFGAMNLGLPKEEVIKRVETAMEKVEVTHLKDNPTHTLSFGQKKRVAVAGILVMQPEVIILDEPTAGLDPMGVSRLMHLLKGIAKEENKTVIISTHDIDMIPVYADYIYAIDKGKILTQGTPEEIFSKPDILRENNLRLPRIAHLLEILSQKDGLDLDFSASTISSARKVLKEYISSIESLK